jgi:hypothetical protein
MFCWNQRSCLLESKSKFTIGFVEESIASTSWCLCQHNGQGDASADCLLAMFRNGCTNNQVAAILLGSR